MQGGERERERERGCSGTGSELDKHDPGARFYLGFLRAQQLVPDHAQVVWSAPVSRGCTCSSLISIPRRHSAAGDNKHAALPPLPWHEEVEGGRRGGSSHPMLPTPISPPRVRCPRPQPPVPQAASRHRVREQFQAGHTHTHTHTHTDKERERE